MHEAETLCDPLSGEAAELERELSQLPGRLKRLSPHIVIGITAAVMTGTTWALLAGVCTWFAYTKVRRIMRSH